MSSGKETGFSEYVSERWVWCLRERRWSFLSTCAGGVVSSGKETEFSGYVSERVWCRLERRPSFLSLCPRGVVSSGKEIEFSEYVSRWCGVFGKGD